MMESVRVSIFGYLSRRGAPYLWVFGGRRRALLGGHFLNRRKNERELSLLSRNRHSQRNRPVVSAEA